MSTNMGLKKSRFPAKGLMTPKILRCEILYVADYEYIYTHCQLCCVIYQYLASDLNTDHRLYSFKFIQAQN